MREQTKHTIALVGLGTIGLSFAALHLKHAGADVRVYDIRKDLKRHICSLLPVYLGVQNLPDPESVVDNLITTGRLTICHSVEEVCAGASIIQEQGPENLDFKKSFWAEVSRIASPTAHLWTSTSGIVASRQVEDLEDKSRLIVVHPFTPPHMTPLMEIVPSPWTNPSEVMFAQRYFAELDRVYRTIVIKKEVTGFVGNRLSFALFREACHLVAEDICTVEDIDTVMEVSHGPRWAVAGLFKLWNWGGGAGGMTTFFRNLGGTMEACWDDATKISLKGTADFVNSKATDVDQEVKTNRLATDEDAPISHSTPVAEWAAKVSQQTIKAYGLPTAEALSQRDADLQRIFLAQPRKAGSIAR